MGSLHGFHFDDPEFMGYEIVGELTSARIDVVLECTSGGERLEILDAEDSDTQVASLDAQSQVCNSYPTPLSASSAIRGTSPQAGDTNALLYHVDMVDSTWPASVCPP